MSIVFRLRLHNLAEFLAIAMTHQYLEVSSSFTSSRKARCETQEKTKRLCSIMRLQGRTCAGRKAAAAPHHQA